METVQQESDRLSKELSQITKIALEMCERVQSEQTSQGEVFLEMCDPKDQIDIAAYASALSWYFDPKMREMGGLETYPVGCIAYEEIQGVIWGAEYSLEERAKTMLEKHREQFDLSEDQVKDVLFTMFELES